MYPYYLWSVLVAFIVFYFFCDWKWEVGGKLNRLEEDGTPCTDAVVRRKLWPVVLLGSLLLAIIWPVAILLFMSDGFNPLKNPFTSSSSKVK